MGRWKPIAVAAMMALVMGLVACEPADDAELMSPENDIIVTSPSP